MIRTMTYRDLSDKQRKQGANKTREKLMGLLNNPFLSLDQRQAVYDKIALVARWEKLQVDAPVVQPAPPPALPPPPRRPALPQHHVVEVKDTVPTKDKVS